MCFSLHSEGWKVSSEVFVLMSDLLALFEDLVFYLSSVTVCALPFVWCCSCVHVSLLLGRNSFGNVEQLFFIGKAFSQQLAFVN